MYPEKFIERINHQEYIDSESLLKALGDPSPVSIRTNHFKWNRIPEDNDPVPWCNGGFYLKARPSFTLDPLFHAGCYYPQEASGMFLEQVFKQVSGGQKDLRVLDLCGAPGGKSTHLSALIGNDGLLVANEVIRTRASVLAENLTKWGLSNAIVTQSDPSAFGRIPGFFDLMLVDAPCSGEGMFRDQVAIDEWSVDNTILCCERQKRILSDAWPALKENGILIYSTCTFNPDENEKNIRWFISKGEAETVRLDISGCEGIKEIDLQGVYGYAFYPGKIRGEGLFMSVLRKKVYSGKQEFRKPKSRFSSPGRDEMKAALELSSFNADRLLMINNEIVALPCNINDYSVLSDVLKIVKTGTAVCTLKRDIIPSHELALSVFLRKSVFFTLNLEYADAIKYLRRDTINTAGTPRGWQIASYEGVNLGFLNNIGTRINNYYPVDWRIRMSVQSGAEQKTVKWKS